MPTHFITIITLVFLLMPLAAAARGIDEGEQLAMAVVADEETEFIDEFAFLEDAGGEELRRVVTVYLQGSF